MTTVVPAVVPNNTIGIIYPPPELRNIVDKTASFVARNGPEFEARIQQNEINNPKFNFLNPGDPYHAYYQHKVKEFKEGKGAPEPTATIVTKTALPLSQKAQEIIKIIEQPIIPKEPPPEFEFIVDPPSISAFDLDVVKLTAQFVARNGRQFLTNLMTREQRNFQFDFLKPQHSLVHYFTKLLEQYTKILIPHKDLMTKLRKEADSQRAVLDQVRYRVEWTKFQEAQKRKEAEEAERERVQYAQIDWHDFVVVETVDYQPNEQGLFPPPTTPDEVGARVLAQQRMEQEGNVEMEMESDGEGSDTEPPPPPGKTGNDNTQVQDMEEESSDEETPPKAPPSPPPLPPKDAPPQPPPLPPQPEQVFVRKDYNPKSSKQQASTTDQYLISPITGERIPADKMQEHMRIGLLDPRWVEQRDRAMQEKLQQEEVYAQGSAIESSLKQFAERRTDIFGSGVEETAIGKKIGEEDKKKPEKVTWDGHTASMEAATRAARANITIEEQIQQIHKIKGLLPDEEKERIGPSKPQNSPLFPPRPPPPPPPPAEPTSTASPATSSSASVVQTLAPATTAAPVPKTQPPPATVVATTIPTPQARPPVPPPITVATIPGPPIAAIIHPTQAILAPPQGIMLPLRTHAPHLQPPPILAMAPRPQLRPQLPPGGPFAPPLGPMPPRPPVMSDQPPLPPNVPPTLKPVGMPPAVPGTTGGDDEPPSKKPKSEENLVPEEDFLAKNKAPVSFQVQLPNISDKVEWKLNGQVMKLLLPLTDSISVIKAKIHEETGMPPGKQKLQYEGMFIKDSNSLAFYNMTPGSVVLLQLKERGGRRK